MEYCNLWKGSCRDVWSFYYAKKMRKDGILLAGRKQKPTSSMKPCYFSSRTPYELVIEFLKEMIDMKYNLSEDLNAIREILGLVK